MRKLKSNKTQNLHRIRLRNYDPNTELRDVPPEGSLQTDDEIVIPQDDLHTISWETTFHDFPTHSDLKDITDDSATDSDQ